MMCAVSGERFVPIYGATRAFEVLNASAKPKCA